jgi:hypothetical protein
MTVSSSSKTEFSGVKSLVEVSSSWEAANCAAAQELPSILWNPNVHFRVHKSPPLIPILSQINPTHTVSSYLYKIHFNIVHPPTPWSSQWSLTFWFSHQYPICIHLLPIRATCHAQLILLNLIIVIILGEEYEFWISSFCSVLRPPVTSSLFGFVDLRHLE